VNNVGMSFPYPGNFLDVPKELSDTIININIKSVNEMTRIVLPRMVEKYVTSLSVSRLSNFSVTDKVEL